MGGEMVDWSQVVSHSQWPEMVLNKLEWWNGRQRQR